MKSLVLAAGVAALAITAPALAQPEKGGGKDRGAKVERGDRGGGKVHTQARKQDRGNRAEARASRPDRAERRAARAERPAKAQQQKVQRAERMRVDRNSPARLERMADRRADVQERRAERRADRFDRVIDRQEARFESAAERQRSLDVLRSREWRDWDDRTLVGRRAGWTADCPPGLARKPVPCIPPGHAPALLGQSLDDVARIVAINEVPQRLRVLYPDTDDYYYRYGNGYLYEVDRETQLINALLPLFGLGLGVGQPFPASYSNYALPTGLQPFYANTGSSQYRYANGYVYQVDPLTGMIVDVDPMLGYGHGYGQMMPLSYSAYNVPYQYRPYYADTSSHYYRYAPGAIYRVDSGSGLIDAVAALLTGGMTVGQQMPMGYDVYNVPLAYRSQYADTPDHWYRYSNGYIYQVDPTTRLVTALVTALT